MNTYAFVARSLISDSWIIRGGFLIMLLFSVILAWFGVFHNALVLSFLVGLGIGVNGLRLRTWETAQLIPGFIRKLAGVTSLICLSLVLFSWTLIVMSAGFQPVWMGLATLAPVLGLWSVCGDARARGIRLMVLACPVLLGVGLVDLYHFDVLWGDQFWDTLVGRWNGLGAGMFSLIGVILYGLAIAILMRLVHVWTRWQALDHEVRSSDNSGQEADWQASSAEHLVGNKTGVKPATEQAESAFEWMSRNCERWLMGSLAFRASKLNSHSGKPWLYRQVVQLTLLILAAVFLIWSRHFSFVVFVVTMAAVGIQLVMPVSGIFVDTRLFERLWVVGAAPNRVSTCRRLIEIGFRRAVSLLLFSVLAILICQSGLASWSVRLNQTLGCLILSFAAFGVGGIAAWAAAAFYSYWRRLSDGAILLYICGLVMGFGMVISCIGLSGFTVEALGEFVGQKMGVSIAIPLIGMLTLGSWLIAWLHGGERLAHQPGWLE